MLGGGRGVHVRRSSSGALINHGSATEPASEMKEKMTSEKLPTRPMSPKVSLEPALGGASYRKYVSPTQVEL